MNENGEFVARVSFQRHLRGRFYKKLLKYKLKKNPKSSSYLTP